MKKIILLVLGLLVLFAIGTRTIPPKTTPKIVSAPTPTEVDKPKYTFPVVQFKERSTKKTFGQEVHDRFTGFHTGVDVEYEDVTNDVPVYAIADGQVTISKWTSGYGGLLVIKHGDTYAIYGHLRPESMVTGKVTAGQQIGALGTNKSYETDGERRHLHFGLAHSQTILGYVQNREDLSGWLDPLEFLGVN